MSLRHNYESNEPRKKYRHTENSIEERRVTFDPEEHSININRRIMERGDLFNADTRGSTYKSSYNDQNRTGMEFPTSNRFGEITGEIFDTSTIEQGMPMRPFYNSKLERLPDIDRQQQQSYNPGIDFNLYDSKPTTNVSYFDPSINSSDPSNNYSNIDDEDQLLNPKERIDSLKYFATTSNLFSWNLLDKFPRNSLTLSSFSILNPIVLLYRGSHNSTENEIKQALLFQSKDVTFESINKLTMKIFTAKNIIGSSLVLTPSTLQINDVFAQYAKNIGKIVPINLSRPNDEILRINNMISNFTKSSIKNFINHDSKIINSNTNIMLLTSAYYRGNWKIPFTKNNMTSYTFKGLNNNKSVNMLRQTDIIHKYYEDNLNQIIEIDYDDNEFTFGIILPKTQGKLQVSHEMYEYYVSQLKATNISNLAIPKFQQSSKFKIDNLFKNMGMIEMFMNADFSEITQSNDMLYVSDIIHQSVLTIEESNDNNYNYNNRISKNVSNARTFIADHPFIYYVRYIPFNIVVFNGYYC